MSYADCNAAGGMTAWSWENDPRRLAFQFARYKFVAKMLEGKKRVLEVGCADGQGSRIVRQHVGEVFGIDSDEEAIEAAIRLRSPKWPVELIDYDILTITDDKLEAMGRFDAVYCLDLFEHIPPEQENALLMRLRACAQVCIIGTPSLESQRFASEISLREHVNCVSKSGLRERVLRHWSQAFLFGMNDETLHVGHDGMTHYLFAVCVA